MSKRSPILGFNHNFKHRGLVFHVQTEDSGVSNPHIFSHLFHGGVILSTRKLDYDAEAAEEVVKSLMQAQHKAVLKDLRRGAFDEKIDAYLGDTPGLLPRKNDAAQGAAIPEKTEDSPQDTLKVPQQEAAVASTAAVAEAAARAETEAAPVDFLEGGQTLRTMKEPEFEPADRARTEQAYKRRDSEVSAAFDAIRAAEEAGPTPASAGAPLEPPALRSPSVPPRAPSASAPQVPDREADSAAVRHAIRDEKSSGSYSQVRPGRRDAARAALAKEPGGQPPLRSSDTPASHRPGARGKARPATPPPLPPDARRPTSQPPPVPPAARAGAPSGKKRRAVERRGAGNQPPVVVSRPAVIVGAPPKVVGGAPRRDAPVRRTQPRLAREDPRRGLFGKDLISEKSLDEVILAYLSEDSEE